MGLWQKSTIYDIFSESEGSKTFEGFGGNCLRHAAQIDSNFRFFCWYFQSPFYMYEVYRLIIQCDFTRSLTKWDFAITLSSELRLHFSQRILKALDEPDLMQQVDFRNKKFCEKNNCFLNFDDECFCNLNKILEIPSVRFLGSARSFQNCRDNCIWMSDEEK